MLDYIKNQFKQYDNILVVYDKGIYINNCDHIIKITDNESLLKLNNKTINIKGNNLSVNKLVSKEILINGNISEIKLEDNDE